MRPCRPYCRTLHHLVIRALAVGCFLSLLQAACWAATFTFGHADGSFDAGLQGMIIQGQGHRISSLGPLRPTQGSHALLLTTAPDDGVTPADASVSLLRIEQVTIPAGVQQLRLDYNFLTNEPTPSFTNDGTAVSLLWRNASGQDVLLEVDTFATFTAAPLTGYARQTGFRTLIADVSAYAGTGEEVTLELRLAEVGDGRGNSALLVDNLHLAAAGEPQACVNVPTVASQAGEAVRFDASCTADGGVLVDYRWDFGDGTVAIGRFPTHTYATAGVYHGTLTVTDRHGQTSTTTFLVVVGGLMHAPHIVSLPVTRATEREPYRYAVRFDDADLVFGDVLTFSLTEAPEGMTLDPATGVITWTPPAGAPRHLRVAVQVTDSTGLSDNQAFTVVVSPEVYIVATDDAGTIYYAHSRGDAAIPAYDL